jgi:hypothetical protein
MCADATPPVRPPSPPPGSQRVRDPSSCPPLENNDHNEEQSPPPRCRLHGALEYSDDDGEELDVGKKRWHPRPCNG